MEVSISGQLSVFGIMLVGGAVSGVLSDLFFVLRRLCFHHRFIIGIADLVLWAMLALGVFGLNLHVNNGELRWYAFLGLFLGAVIYFLLLSTFVRKVFAWICTFLLKILRLILKIVLTIAAFLYKIINGMFLFFARTCAPIGRQCKSGGKCVGEKVRRGFSEIKLVLRKK